MKGGAKRNLTAAVGGYLWLVDDGWEDMVGGWDTAEGWDTADGWDMAGGWDL